jgi:hypothetical protein
VRWHASLQSKCIADQGKAAALCIVDVPEWAELALDKVEWRKLLQLQRIAL